SFPRQISAASLAEFDVHPYTRADEPDYNPATQVLVPGSFTQESGAWVQGWTVRSMPSEEQAQATGTLRAQINAERGRRMVEPFTFAGKPFDFSQESKTRISGAGTLAGFSLAAGAQAGDYLWHGGDEPFAWIADDNSVMQMDAQTVFAFGQAAAARVSAIVFAARTLKDASPIPADYADD
ncbi:hypothetical protein BTA51_28965, partial [Hahella sp. CCB-MM4]|uniref:DUF4376 domain-containing protein n=1 Tax=Hahella sp. (strain CCB-MM4) TaxID=1926491 RepID=UPI000BD33775